MEDAGERRRRIVQEVRDQWVSLPFENPTLFTSAEDVLADIKSTPPSTTGYGFRISDDFQFKGQRDVSGGGVAAISARLRELGYPHLASVQEDGYKVYRYVRLEK